MSVEADAGKTPDPDGDIDVPVEAHIAELVRRIGVVVVMMAVVSGVVFPVGEEIIWFIWSSVLPSGSATVPRAYSPLSLIITQAKVAMLAGFIAALPTLVYETYLFLKPGLFQREQKYYLAAVPTSLIFAVAGVGFAFYAVLPTLFGYFKGYSQDVAVVAFGLQETFNLILMLMGMFAAVFQIPLFMMMAVIMGVVDRYWFARRRFLFWMLFGGISFLFTPDPTGMAPLATAATMVVLFEGTLLMMRWFLTSSGQ